MEIAERIGDSFSRSQAWFFFGLAQQLRGEWQQAIQAIERSQTIARERRTALETQPWRLVRLAESHLALGDPDRARRLVEEGVDLARRGAQAGVEALGWVTLARVLLASAREDAQAEIAGALDRALELANTTEAKIIVPRVHVERADLARLTGNEDGHHRELREAHRLYSEMGAVGLAQSLAEELATSPR